MGYYSRVRPSFKFDTPLTDEELNTFFATYDYLGYLTAPEKDGIWDTNEHGKAYYLEDEIRLMVKTHPGVGEFIVEGEESSDIWRLLVNGSEVKKEEATIRWPDGTEYTSGY